MKVLSGAVLLACIAAFGLTAGVAQARRPLRLERVVMLVRHGVRAPLPDEAAASIAPQPWPVWSTPGSFLTPHGREGMRLLGVYDHARYAAAGLLPSSGCPAPGSVSLWSNSVERTIASGEAWAEGLAPGCGLKVDHLPLGHYDPLFAWAGPELKGFDAAAAVAAINAETGGAARIAAASTPAIKTLETILGCRAPGVSSPCDLAAQPAAITVSPDGKSIDVSGPIRLTSGAAQVLMLQYLEGLPMDQVGWGRASLDQITEVSRLHALLFDVYSRPAFMAPRVAHDLGKRLMDLIGGAGAGRGKSRRGKSRRGKSRPALAVIVGHDDNIAAMTALLDADFQMPGYGYDDPPPGSALIFEVYRAPHHSARFVRVWLQAQTPDQLRALQPLDLAHPPSLQALRLKSCSDPKTGLCSLHGVMTMLRRKLAD